MYVGYEQYQEPLYYVLLAVLYVCVRVVSVRMRVSMSVCLCECVNYKMYTNVINYIFIYNGAPLRHTSL